jgi:hypothetical protein
VQFLPDCGLLGCCSFGVVVWWVVVGLFYVVVSVFWGVGLLRFGGLRFCVGLFLMESLILAQDERWRRA